jgi:L-aspartate oxidase
MPVPPSFDVLVIGAGAAGLYTALALPRHLQVGLVTKDSLTLSASDWAQGGIAAVVDPNDSTDLHIQDTLQAGAGLCDGPAVKFLVENAAHCIADLVQMGVEFDRHHGSLALTLEAAHSRRRVLHAADTTGRAVVSALAAEVLHRPNVQVIDHALTLDVGLDTATQRCNGAWLFYQGQQIWVQAGAVILATGGGGQVYAQTTNPALSTGDGVAIAHRAGAILRDLEFVQFHPTALTRVGAPRFLISEAVRGEGAHLVDAQGKRFAFDYHPDGELAPRDVVSRAIFSYLQSTQADPSTGHVYLDLRVIDPERVRYRFPNIIQICQHWGIDVFQEPIPVAPAAHYWMGGIATDVTNQTSIAGLYAVGEAASTGVHGANRLASNSLLECIVFGAQFAQLQVPTVAPDTRNTATVLSPPEGIPAAAPSPEEWATLAELRQALPRLLWQSAGICREGDSMQAAIAQVQAWQTTFQTLPLRQTLSQTLSRPTAGQPVPDLTAEDCRLWAETRNLLEVADLLLQSAHYRTESRGGHYRTDYPHTDPAWAVHTVVQRYQLSTGPVT